MQFFIVLYQRLISTDWKTAGGELTLALTAFGAVYADIKAKNFGQVLTDFPAFWVPIGILAADFRMIVSSNTKAIANPALPKIVGDGSQPINVPIPK